MNSKGTKIDKRDDLNPDCGENKYGNVEFADSTNNKYPIDTPEHIGAAWGYINHKNNAAKYEPDEVKVIKDRIEKAVKNMELR